MACCGGEAKKLKQEKEMLENRARAQEEKLVQLEKDHQAKHAEAEEHKTAKERLEEEKKRLEDYRNQLEKDHAQLKNEHQKQKTDLAIHKEEKESIKQQMSAEIDKVVAESSNKGEGMEHMQELYVNQLDDCRNMIGHLSSGGSELVLLEVYDGDSGAFLAEQLIDTSKVRQEIRLTAHGCALSRSDAKKPNAHEPSKILSQKMAQVGQGNYMAIVERKFDKNNPDAPFQMCLRSIYQEKSSQGFRDRTPLPRSISHAIYHQQERHKVLKWELISQGFGITVPGETLQPPDELDWVTDWSIRVQDEPQHFEIVPQKSQKEKHAEVVAAQATLRADQLESEMKEKEAIVERKEKELDRMRVEMESRNKDLEAKIEEAKRLLAPSVTSSGTKKSEEERRSLQKENGGGGGPGSLDQQQPVSVKLPGLESLSEENTLRFFQLLLQEDSGILYQDDAIEVHWLQSFPFTNDDFYHHAERGLLAGRVDLKLFSKGFESIHLKCTNNDVKGLKVVPLPISAAATSNVMDTNTGPPQVIIQTICVELLEHLEAHPYVKCDLTIMDTADSIRTGAPPERYDHACTFALPIVLLKFCLPWEVTPKEFLDFCNVCTMTSAAIDSNRLVLHDDFPASLLSFGGILSEVERGPGARIKLGTSLVKHGNTKKDMNIGILLDERKMEVRTEDRRLSEIIMFLLHDYYDYCTSHLKEMRDGVGQVIPGH